MRNIQGRGKGEEKMKRFLCAFLVAATMTSVASSVNAEINNLNIRKSSITKAVESNAVIQSELPVIEITTENGQDVTSKDYYLKGNVKITGNGQFDGYSYEGSMQIKGRGNSTWGMPKKPYRIKFDTKQNLLGMHSGKEYKSIFDERDGSCTSCVLSRKTFFITIPRITYMYPSLSISFELSLFISS